jgi:hypothetical protein
MAVTNPAIPAPTIKTFGFAIAVLVVAVSVENGKMP